MARHIGDLPHALEDNDELIRRLKSSLYLDINNLTNSKRTKYQAYESRQLDTQIYGMRITAGISGEF